MQTNFAYYKCELGFVKIGYTDTVIFIELTDKPDSENTPSELSDTAFSQIREYLDGKRKSFDFPMKLSGTDFGQRCLRALLDVPYGSTASYKDIAAAIGNPGACRAVGSACNKNPLWIAVPCHRIIASDGSLGGYEGGLRIKKHLLKLEKENK